MLRAMILLSSFELKFTSHSHVPSDVSASCCYESMIVGVLHHENILAIGVCVLCHPHKSTNLDVRRRNRGS